MNAKQKEALKDTIVSEQVIEYRKKAEKLEKRYNKNELDAQSWGATILNHEMYERQKTKQFLNDLVLISLNNFVYFVFGFVLAVCWLMNNL